ncbi:MAG: DUF302 domain-containing protein [Brevirhabdus sp.]
MKSFAKFVAAASVALTAGFGAVAQEAEEFDNSLTYAGPDAGVGPDWMPEGGYQMPAGSKQDFPPNTVQTSVISAEAKLNMMQTMMMANPMSLRQMMNMMVAKKKVVEGVSFEEVIESMDLRANFMNMKKVGHNTPWKVIEATTGEPSPKIEMLSYCDIPTMRDIVDYVPEFGVFVPCRITVLEDAAGDLWIMTMDWDVRWLDTSPNPNKISPELREKAIKVREAIESIMEAGANGDL